MKVSYAPKLPRITFSRLTPGIIFNSKNSKYILNSVKLPLLVNAPQDYHSIFTGNPSSGINSKFTDYKTETANLKHI